MLWLLGTPKGERVDMAFPVPFRIIYPSDSKNSSQDREVSRVMSSASPGLRENVGGIDPLAGIRETALKQGLRIIDITPFPGRRNAGDNSAPNPKMNGMTGAGE